MITLPDRNSAHIHSCGPRFVSIPTYDMMICLLKMVKFVIYLKMLKII